MERSLLHAKDLQWEERETVARDVQRAHARAHLCDAARAWLRVLSVAAVMQSAVQSRSAPRGCLDVGF